MSKRQSAKPDIDPAALFEGLGFEVDHPLEELPPVADIISRRRDQYARKSAAHEAARLITVRVTIDGPIGILHMGDPHIDDDGCDIAAIERHASIVRKTPGMFGANVGDLRNNWIGRLAHLFGQQSTSAREALALTEWLLKEVPWLYLIGGNHDCLDTKTEALTQRGWLRIDEIRSDDSILSLDRDGTAAWGPILKIIDRPNTEPMVNIESQSISLSATQSHRVLHRKRGWEKRWTDWGFSPAADLPPRFALPVSGHSTSKSDLSDAQIELAGWLLTDGSIQWQGKSPRVSFWQSKTTEPIERLLNRLEIPYKTIVRDRAIESVCGRTLVKPARPQTELRLSAAASRIVLKWVPEKGRLPSWAMELSDEQFGVLLDGLVGGDGVWENAEKSVAVIHGAAAFLDSVQAAAVAHGWRSFISVARGKDYRLNLCRTDQWQAERSVVVSTGPPADRVWCLTVPLGNFMVRRNGKAHFTGNCWSGDNDPIDWIMRTQPGVFANWGARLRLAFPNGREVRVNARHDFRGHSMWNAAHGPSKAVQMGWRDHLLTCGHTHVTGYAILKCPATGLVSHAVRVAGYKMIDRYAIQLGLPNQNISPAVVTVIDPSKGDDSGGLVQVFWDVETAADFLRFLRRRKS